MALAYYNGARYYNVGYYNGGLSLSRAASQETHYIIPKGGPWRVGRRKPEQEESERPVRPKRRKESAPVIVAQPVSLHSASETMVGAVTAARVVSARQILELKRARKRAALLLLLCG